MLLISNAIIERTFSICNIIKDKLRNKLSIAMLQSMMIIAKWMFLYGFDVVFLQHPCSIMLRLFRKRRHCVSDVRTIYYLYNLVTN